MFLDDESKAVADSVDRGVRTTVAAVFGWGLILTHFFLATASTAELFIRQRVGLFYLLISGPLAIATAHIFQAIWLKILFRPYNEAFGCFLIAFEFAWATHLLDLILAKDKRHSWQTGVPAIWPDALRRWLGLRGAVYFGEPLLCVVVGGLVTFSAPMLGVWLIIAGIALFLKALIVGGSLAEAVRDHMDREMDAQVLNEEIRATRTTVTVTEEIHVVRPADSSDRQ